MFNDSAREISSFSHSFNTLQNYRERFTENLKTKLDPSNQLAKLEVESESIHAVCYGHKIEAKPRVVKSNSNRIALEYRFTVRESNDKEIEVWRFYLLQNGLLSNQIDVGSGFSGIDDPEVAQIICNSLTLGVIQSDIFQPTPSLNQSSQI